MGHLELFIEALIALIVILFMAQMMGRLIRLLGQPAVVGEMISGVLLGPTFFGHFFPDASAAVFPVDTMSILFFVSNLGLSIYMFLVGAEMDLSHFNPKAVRRASVLSVVAIMVPFGFGALSAALFNDAINSNGIPSVQLTIFMGTALAITAFPMLARILQEKGIVNTRLGSLSLLSASLQDVVSWVLLGLVTAMSTKGDYTGIVIMVLGATLLVLVLFFVVRPMLRATARHVNVPADLSPTAFAVVMGLLLVCALATDWLGLYSVFGGFVLGLAMPRDKGYVQALSVRLKDLTVVFLLPVFFAFSGLNTNMLGLGASDMIVPTVVIVIFAFMSKYLSCTFTMKLSGFNWADSSAVGGLLNARGLMELIIANIGLFYGLIDRSVYSILVLVAVSTTLAAMPIYNASLSMSGKRGRS
jgi:Kef-type K+ transport system membrane component KefB